jgi:hypothetical protein
MTVEDTNVVDAVGTDRQSGAVVLTISDHLDWSDETTHLVTLQDKINAYLQLIESGQLERSYPDAKDREVRIEVVAKHEPSPEAESFFCEVEETLGEAGLGFRHRILTV